MQQHFQAAAAYTAALKAYHALQAKSQVLHALTATRDITDRAQLKALGQLLDAATSNNKRIVEDHLSILSRCAHGCSGTRWHEVLSLRLFEHPARYSLHPRVARRCCCVAAMRDKCVFIYVRWLPG